MEEAIGSQNPEILHVFSNKEVAEISGYQSDQTIDEITKLQNWKARSLEEVGRLVVK